MTRPERKVGFRSMVVSVLGRHLLHTRAANNDDGHDHNNPTPYQTSGFTMDLLSEGTFHQLDLRIYKKYNTPTTAVFVVVKPATAHIWHKRLAHACAGELKATANIKELGCVITDTLSPCGTCVTQKSTQKKHPKTVQHRAGRPMERFSRITWATEA